MDQQQRQPTNRQFRWDFGDGSSPPYRDQESPTHSYQRPGTYTVTLSLIDPTSGEETSQESTRVTVREDSYLSTQQVSVRIPESDYDESKRLHRIGPTITFTYYVIKDTLRPDEMFLVVNLDMQRSFTTGEFREPTKITIHYKDSRGLAPPNEIDTPTTEIILDTTFLTLDTLRGREPTDAISFIATDLYDKYFKKYSIASYVPLRPYTPGPSGDYPAQFTQASADADFGAGTAISTKVQFILDYDDAPGAGGSASATYECLVPTQIDFRHQDDENGGNGGVTPTTTVVSITGGTFTDKATGRIIPPP